jgi:hypothetical protein
MKPAPGDGDGGHEDREPEDRHEPAADDDQSDAGTRRPEA